MFLQTPFPFPFPSLPPFLAPENRIKTKHSLLPPLTYSVASLQASIRYGALTSHPLHEIDRASFQHVSTTHFFILILRRTPFLFPPPPVSNSKGLRSAGAPALIANATWWSKRPASMVGTAWEQWTGRRDTSRSRALPYPTTHPQRYIKRHIKWN